MPKRGDEMAVVKEVQTGGVTIRIHDDCCLNASDDEAQAVLNRIAANALAAINAAQGNAEKAG